VSETTLDFVSTIYDAMNRAMQVRPYTAVRMHPETARRVKRAAKYYEYSTPSDTAPSLLGLLLIQDTSVEPGQFRFEYEVAATLRAMPNQEGVRP
jgi:hypothetical protein